MSRPLDLPARLRAWTFQQQGLSPAVAGEPAEALRGVVGVYSSHPTAPLSLLARCSDLDAASFRDLEQGRQAVRLPAMRGSIYLLPVESAPRVLAATRVPLVKLAPQLRYGGFDADSYTRFKQQVLELVREPMTPAELQAALGAAEGAASESRMTVGMRIMSREGLTLRIGTGLRSDSWRYVATDAWLGHPLAEPDPEESLSWLAEEYLRAYGPARVQDFAWWSGAQRRRAAAALDRVATVDVGDGHLLPADLQSAFDRVPDLDPQAITILPKWDTYTMGHAPDGRQRLIDDEHLSRAYTRAGNSGATAGDGLPLVLRGGRAIATWGHRFEGKRLRVSLSPFEAWSVDLRQVESAFEPVGRLLEASDIRVAAGEVSP